MPKKAKQIKNSIEGLAPDKPLPASALSSIENPGEPKAAWFTMNQRPLLALLGALPLDALAQNEFRPDPSIKFTEVHFRVMLQLIGKMGFGNWVSIAQTKLSEELKISPQAYSRALQGLQKARIIVRPYISTDFGVRPLIMVNPELAKKGKAEDIQKSLKIFDNMLKNNHFRSIKGVGGQHKGPKKIKQ